MGIKRAHSDGLPIITYIHPWEIDPEQPRLPIKFLSKLRHYVNLSRTYDRLARMLHTDAYTSFQESHLAETAEEIDLNACRHQN